MDFFNKLQEAISIRRLPFSSVNGLLKSYDISDLPDYYAPAVVLVDIGDGKFRVDLLRPHTVGIGICVRVGRKIKCRITGKEKMLVGTRAEILREVRGYLNGLRESASTKNL